MAEIKANFILEIATATPRRLTNYRGRTATGLRGLVVDALYYKTAIVEIPGIEESDNVAPLQIQLSIGNADNTVTDLYADTANIRKPVTIRRVEFSGTWSEAIPPTVTASAWFEGFIGRVSIRGERVLLECHADMGRRGSAPATKSRTLMLNHQPISPQQKLTIITSS